MSKPQVMPVADTDIAQDNELPVKYQMFVNAYFATNFNPTEAAIAAGYSAKSARTTGLRLLRNDTIARAVQQKLNKKLEPLNVQADEVIALLVSHMRGSFEHFIDEDGVIDFKKAKQAEKLNLIRKIRSRATTVVNGSTDTETHIVESEVELYDAQSAAVQLGKHLDLFNNKLDITYTELSKMSDEELLKLTAGKR
jgi:phage terminase small subunit